MPASLAPFHHLLSPSLPPSRPLAHICLWTWFFTLSSFKRFKSQLQVTSDQLPGGLGAAASSFDASQDFEMEVIAGFSLGRDI